MSSPELFGFSEVALKWLLSLAVAIIPALIALAVAFRAGRSVANELRGLARAIVGQMDEVAEQEAVGKALGIDPALVKEFSDLLTIWAQLKSATPVVAQPETITAWPDTPPKPAEQVTAEILAELQP